jgi:hypothetical protein
MLHVSPADQAVKVFLQSRFAKDLQIDGRRPLSATTAAMPVVVSLQNIQHLPKFNNASRK